MASGDQNITGTSANEHLNGGSGNDTINGGGGNDFINAGSGNDVVNGGSGSDRVNGDSGNDILIYRQSENAAGTTDIYDGGSGIDTIRLELTRAQWLNATLQSDIAQYLQFLAANTLPNGQAKNTEFRFDAFDLRVSKIENLWSWSTESRSTYTHLWRLPTRTAWMRSRIRCQPRQHPVLGRSFSDRQCADERYRRGCQRRVERRRRRRRQRRGPVSGNVGGTVTGTYGTLTLGANGTWTYTLLNGDGDTNARANLRDRDHRLHRRRRELDAGGNHRLAPEHSDSVLSGNFGTLNINQAGNWSYNLDNSRAATQALAQGQTDTDTFTVQVTDEFGASDTETVTVTVTGTNDAPVMQTAAVSRTTTEDSETPDLTETGLAQFSDVDLIDVHGVGASLQSATLSNGDPVSPALSALLAGAMTASLNDSAASATAA